MHTADYTEAQAEYNQNKNRFPDKLPSEYGHCVNNYAATKGKQYTTKGILPSCSVLVYMCST